jgi:serine/threonine protein kinase/tetratricopeptide (TPR) repeat protein
MSNRERDIFTCAFELVGERRSAFLEAACGGDRDLRSRVETLLRASDSAGPFLLDRDAEVGEQAGALIGPYRLEARLGEGGFGSVWRARQESPVRRTVALKIIKLGMDTRAVVTRFAAERQALALMDHPNIARVFDAGATSTGRPFFVMELIEGTNITRFCREERLGLRARLQLFLQICSAVQHAHQKGIIHRDLKPSNVLVTRRDGAAQLKVIDFGVAKATREPLIDATLASRLHLFLGTPAYMSPEQLGLGESRVDTRADIYALGALLHELLAEVPPFDLQGASGSLGFAAMERKVLETEPVPPSRRLAALPAAELAVLAAARRTTAARLVAETRGDLDQIVLKCLEKDRERRYGTAHALARDIERYLQDEPVLARPATTLYRVRKFCRRHTRAVCAFSVVTLGGIAFGLYHAQRLAAERDRARIAAQKARRVSDLLTSVLMAPDPYRSPGEGAGSIPEMLANAADRARREFAQEPDVRADVLSAVGRVHLRTGRYKEAGQVLGEALAASNESGQRDARRALILSDLGVLQRELGHLAAAVPYLEESLAIRRELFPAGHNDVAITLVELGRVHRAAEQFQRAEPLLREALEMRQRVLGEHRETATSQGDLGLLYWNLGRTAEAEQLLSECLAMSRRTLGDEHANSAQAGANLALVVRDRGDLVRAEELTRTSVGIMQRTLGHQHWRTARTKALLALLWHAQAQHDAAAELMAEALAQLRDTLGSEHVQTALTEVDSARVLLARDDAAAAEALLRHALAVQQRPGVAPAWRIGVTKSLLGGALLRQGRLAEAETLLAEAAALLPSGPGPSGAESPANGERLRAVREALALRAAPHRSSPP